MKIFIISLSIIFSNLSLAGTGHGHSHQKQHKHPHKSQRVSEKKTVELAKFHIDRLIKENKLDESWRSAVYAKTDEKEFSGRAEWVVTFDNEKADSGKRKLFIFLKLSGEFIAANFSGK